MKGTYFETCLFDAPLDGESVLEGMVLYDGHGACYAHTGLVGCWSA